MKIYFLIINLFKLLPLLHLITTSSVVDQLQQQQSFLNQICQSGIREDNTNYIHCARRNLQEIPPLNKNNLIYDELVLTDNQISELNELSFSRIKVKKIYLNNNPIKRIDNRTFIRLANNLEELWLDSDADESISGIPFAIIYYLRNLQILHLKNFNIITIESNQLQKLQRLEILGLQACNVRTVDVNGFAGLVNLKELYLDSNQLDRIPTEALNELKSLRILSLAQNNIKIINAGSFSRLVQLDLSYNGLKQIDASAFNTLNSTLEKLYLQNNELNSYNLNFIKSLTKLHELNLDFNILKSLTNPSNNDLVFKNAKNLQYLSIQGNQIQFEVKQELVFMGLSNLQRLNLARNNIKHIPSNLFQPLKQLQSLILDRNQVENLNEISIYNGLEQNLVNISLQNMKINRQEKLLSLSNLSNLERIRLGFNELESVDLTFFLNISKNLQLLDLQNNKIHSIVTKSSEQQQQQQLINKNLLEFDLTNNKLCSFNAPIILKQLMPKLKYLSLTQNPLFCDCLLSDLHNWVMSKYDKEFLTFIQWSCTGPIDNLNKKFTSLNPNDFKCNEEINKTRLMVCVEQQVTPAAPLTTTSSTNSPLSAAAQTSHNDENLVKIPHIVDININSYLNNLLISWNIDSTNTNTNNNENNFNGFRVTIDDLTSKTLIKSAIIDKTKRSFTLNDVILTYATKYSICMSVLHVKGYDKYCRDFQLNDVIQLSRTSEQPPPPPSLAFVYDNDDLTFKEYNAHVSSSNNVSSSSSTNIFTNTTILITFVIILVVFILLILILFFLFVRKCDKTKRTKSPELSNIDTMYSFSKPISTTNQNLTSQQQQQQQQQADVLLCCCFNASSSAVDTSTVSSTLSSVTNPVKDQQQQHQTTLLVPINDLNILTNESFQPQQLHSTWARNTHKSIKMPLLTSSTIANNNNNNNTSNSTSPTSSFNFIHPSYSYGFNNSNSNRLEPEHVYCEIPSTTINKQHFNSNYNNKQPSILIFEPSLSTSSTSNLIPINQRLLQQQQQYQHFLNNNQNFNVSII